MITLSLQTDLNVKEVHMVLCKNWLLDYWAVNKNLSISLVNGLHVSLTVLGDMKEKIFKITL